MPKIKKNHDDKVRDFSVSGRGLSWSPGSPDAELEGCRCPISENNNGLGLGESPEGNKLYWIKGDCPLHGTR